MKDKFCMMSWVLSRFVENCQKSFIPFARQCLQIASDKSSHSSYSTAEILAAKKNKERQVLHDNMGTVTFCGKLSEIFYSSRIIDC